MFDRIHVYKCSMEKTLVLASNVPYPRKRRGVRPELDIVISLLCDQSDFMRVEDLPQ